MMREWHPLRVERWAFSDRQSVSRRGCRSRRKWRAPIASRARRAASAGAPSICTPNTRARRSIFYRDLRDASAGGGVLPGVRQHDVAADGRRARRPDAEANALRSAFGACGAPGPRRNRSRRGLAGGRRPDRDADRQGLAAAKRKLAQMEHTRGARAHRHSARPDRRRAAAGCCTRKRSSSSLRRARQALAAEARSHVGRPPRECTLLDALHASSLPRRAAARAGGGAHAISMRLPVRLRNERARLDRPDERLPRRAGARRSHARFRRDAVARTPVPRRVGVNERFAAPIRHASRVGRGESDDATNERHRSWRPLRSPLAKSIRSTSRARIDARVLSRRAQRPRRSCRISCCADCAGTGRGDRGTRLNYAGSIAVGDVLTATVSARAKLCRRPSDRV